MLSILLPTQLLATEPTPLKCDDPTLTEQIKAYVSCQGSTALASCGALGGTVAGYVASKYLHRRYLKLMQTSLDELTRDAAEAARDEDRAARRLNDPKARLAQLDEEIKGARRSERIRVDKAPLTDDLAQLYRAKFDRPPNAGELTSARQALEVAIKLNPDGPVFEPLMITKPLDEMAVTYDVANAAFEKLPPAFRADYEDRVRTTAALLKRRLAEGLPLDDLFIERATREVHAAWLKEARKRPQKIGLELSDNAPLPHEVRAARRIVRKAVERLKTAEVSILARGLGPAIALARKLGPAGPLAAGGILGASLWAVGQVADARSTACASAHSPYVNEDAGRSCAPRCEVNENVATFLAKPDHERSAILTRFPEACAFYRKLHECFFRQPKFEGLSCEGVSPKQTRLVLKARDESGAVRTYRADLRDDWSVSAIGVYNAGGMKTRLYNFANVDETLTTKLGTASGAARELRQLKMFIPEAADCCRDQRADCAARFGSLAHARPAPSQATANAQ